MSYNTLSTVSTFYKPSQLKYLPRNYSIKRIQCHSHNTDAGRRALLVGTGVSLLTPGSPQLIAPSPVWADKIQGELGVSNLSGFQKDDQRKAVLKAIQEELAKVLTGADANLCLRLVFNDAATYDVSTKTGGVDGSIIFDEELNRPENVSLKPIVAKLKDAKKQIDARITELGSGSVSWADLICIAARFTAKKSWADIKIKRAATDVGGDIVVTAFASEFPLDIGRIDATEPNVSGKILAADSSVQEIRDFLYNLGRKEGEGEGFFSKKPLFWERPGYVIYTATCDNPQAAEEEFAKSDKIYADLKVSYDRSRATITRTDYEVDFANYFNRLANLGAKFDKDAYLHPIKTVFKL
eukprot:TRINITY_DN14761_c0_g2_i5.p1 TRINITY_DN14761_c0_g2~~TRINITY_DN14761_c0_g2_i5.p1  ORF type:complete len:354 (-),score=45.21 TRINITY_DN14761_c0_g2_i5:147-1208(-)